MPGDFKVVCIKCFTLTVFILLRLHCRDTFCIVEKVMMDSVGLGSKLNGEGPELQLNTHSLRYVH